MSTLSKILNKNFHSTEEIYEIKQLIQNKNYTFEDIKYFLVCCSNIKWNPLFKSYEESFFFVFENLVFKKFEPENLLEIFKKYASVKIKIENSNKILGFNINFKVPKKIEKYLRNKNKEIKLIENEKKDSIYNKPNDELDNIF